LLFFFSIFSKQYVVRDSTKEKPTYIMVPKREEHTHREKAIAGNSGGMLVPNQEIANSNTFIF